MIVVLLGLQLAFDVWLLVHLRVFKITNPFIKKTIAQLARPINPNTNIRPCQFCSKLPATLSKDGYYACASCMGNVLHQ